MTPSQAAQEKPTSPRTEAGRTLVQRMLSSKTEDRMGPDDLQRAILAIEREAAQGAAPLDKYDSMADYEEHMAALGDPDLEGAAPACRHDAKWIEQFTDWVIRAHEQRKSDRAAPRAEGLEREAAAATPSPMTDAEYLADAARREAREAAWPQLHHDRAAAATPSLPDVRYALGLVKRIHSASEEWTKYDEDTPGDAEQAIRRIGKSVRAELGLVIEALARLDEGSATPDQGKGEPR